MISNYAHFMKELEKTKKILSEAYLLNSEDQMDGPIPNYDDEELDYPEEEMHQPEAESKNLDDQDISRYDERIAKIREVAIQGLQDYAENVNDARYQFFKKVFLECDKACQEKDGGNVK